MANEFDSAAYAAAHQEKKIGSYEAIFKESAFAKPQNIYFTITAGHIFGEAFVMEQQGTMEGDPVYCRFVCGLEDITKVYINDRVKVSPLFIQCDTDVKGVVHRKRIIVPCLPNVKEILEEIKKVHAVHMKKFEETKQRERERKLEELRRNEGSEPVQEQEAQPEAVAPEKRSIYFDPSLPASLPPRKKPSKLELTADLEEDLKTLEKLSMAVSANAGTSKQESQSGDSPEVEKALEALKGEIEEITAPKKRLKKAKSDIDDQVPELDTKKIKAPKKIKHNPDEVESIAAGEEVNTEEILGVPAAVEQVENSVEEISAGNKKPPKVKTDIPDELLSLELPPIVELSHADELSTGDMLTDVDDAIAEEKAAEEARLAEEAKLAQEKAEAEAKAAEEARIAEEKRLAEEKAAEEARLAAEAQAAEEARLAEEQRLEEERKAKERASSIRSTEKVRTVPNRISEGTQSGGLKDFEDAMKALAARKNELSPEEYAQEKKKIIATLY